MSAFIKPTKVKARCKELGKRVGRGFLAALDLYVAEKIDAACKTHNGGRITLDREVAAVVFGKIR